MTLTAALSGALSSLRANQSILTAISANITNANTPGYSSQTPTLSVQVAAGQAIGVDLARITRNVDSILVTQMNGQNSSLGRTQVMQDFMDKLLFLFGQPGAGNDLNARMNSFYSTISSASASPGDYTLQSLAVDAGVNLSNFISDNANELIDLQFRIDREISSTVTRINNIISQIKDVNSSISGSVSQGQGVNALLDQRDLLVNELSGLIDITTIESSEGLITIFASNGSSQYTLLNSEGSNVKLAYTPATTESVFSNNGTLGSIDIQFLDQNDNVLISQEFVAGGTVGEITSNLQGKLGGLLRLRDYEIPEVLEVLDNFAGNLIERFNALHNNGSGIPPRSTLLGTLLADSGDALSITGKSMFAVLNQNGTPISSPWSHLNQNANGTALLPPLVIDYDAIQSADGSDTITPDIIRKEFNEYYNEIENYASVGPLGNLQLRGSSATGSAPITSASFNLEAMNISSGNATIVVNSIVASGGSTVGALPSALTSGFTVGAGEREFDPSTFTVNFAGSGTYTISVDVTVTDADGATYDTTLTYSFDTTQANSNVQSERYPPVTASEDGTIINPSPLTSIANMSFVDADGDAVAAGANGYMKISTTSSSAGIAISEMTGEIEGATSTRGISHYFGLNDFFVEARGTTLNPNPNRALSLEVTEDIANNAAYFSRARLQLSAQPSGSNVDPLHTYELGAGDGSALQDYIDMFLTPQEFSAAGSIAAITTTFGSYSGTFTELVALKTSNATSINKKEQLIYDGLVSQQQAFSGVNVDNELANSILYQNAFSAAARIIRTVDELFDDLLNLKR